MPLLAILVICLSLCTELSGQDLESQLWRHRVLIIYTDDEHLAPHQNQLKELKTDTAALNDRKIVVLEIIDNQYRWLDYDKKPHAPVEKLSPLMSGILSYKSLHEVILIGLDGGTKLRQNHLLTIDDLSDIVDAMPMRKAELRKRKKSQTDADN